MVFFYRQNRTTVNGIRDVLLDTFGNIVSIRKCGGLSKCVEYLVYSAIGIFIQHILYLDMHIRSHNKSRQAIFKTVSMLMGF